MSLFCAIQYIPYVATLNHYDFFQKVVVTMNLGRLMLRSKKEKRMAHFMLIQSKMQCVKMMKILVLLLLLIH